MSNHESIEESLGVWADDPRSVSARVEMNHRHSLEGHLEVVANPTKADPTPMARGEIVILGGQPRVVARDTNGEIYKSYLAKPQS